MKMLIELKNNMFNGVTSTISQFKPGTYSKLGFPQTVCGEWKYEIKEQRYIILPFTNNIQMSDELITNMLQNVKMSLKNAVKR